VLHMAAALNRYLIKVLSSVLLLSLFSLSTLVPFVPDRALADTRTLGWRIVNTPSTGPANVIVSPCEINAMAVGYDDRTFYCVDTSDNRTYKSIDGGYTWLNISDRLMRAGASQRTWDIVIAPDDVNFIMAVTDSRGGPGQIFYSTDGGATWRSAGFPELVDEYISCIDISSNYAGSGTVRDIAVGTRSIVSPGKIPGRVFTCQFSTTSFVSWIDTSGESSLLKQSFSSLRFSPNYDADRTIAVISSTENQTLLHLGRNTGTAIYWDTDYAGYPIEIKSDIIPGGWDNIIKSCLELPSDFNGDLINQRACFASILTGDSTTPSAVVYLNTNLSRPDYKITPPVAGIRIASIAYKGSEATGILLAGEANTPPERGMVNIWQCSNPQTVTPGGATWLPSDLYKSPTGGGRSGRANAILKWGTDSQIAYCGTSSENTTSGGTGLSPGQWPTAKKAGCSLDESAFSRSTDNGRTWNQIGLIDTYINYLSDAGAHEIAEGKEDTDQINILYLSSINDNATSSENITFDSVWRSISDPLGDRWERILTRRTSDTGTILRLNPREDASGKCVAFADLSAENITFSADMGQTWQEIPVGMRVRDLCFFNDSTIYILGDYSLRRIVQSGSSWILGKTINTNMESTNHTVSAPLRNLVVPGKVSEEIVFVGSTEENGAYVAWIDFSKFNPQFIVLKQLPEKGNVHIAIDSEFDLNRFIYVALDTPIMSGSIYRWKLGISTDWDELEPLNRDFYGIETGKDVLYAAWDYNSTNNRDEGGIDRTLYARSRVPPPPEWDDLTAGLPTDNASMRVHFTREPTSLHISFNRYNTLWAIDNREYKPDLKQGCLWSYIDSAARLGPWPTSPPTGSYIGTDPVTGRAQQVDFKWRELQDMKGYDLLIAKDVDFTQLLSQNLNLAPVDNRSGAWIIEPADWRDPAAWLPPGLLESGRAYYWRVRGSKAISGETIHSRWSPVMLFQVKPGFIVSTVSPGPTLLYPADGLCISQNKSVAFSWSPVKSTTKYEFILASDPDLKEILVKAYTSTTSYQYNDGNLELSKPYYWRVRAITPVLSDPSPTATFSLIENPLTSQQNISVITRTLKTIAPGISSETFIWIMIILAYLLIILIIVYAIVSRTSF